MALNRILSRDNRDVHSLGDWHGLEHILRYKSIARFVARLFLAALHIHRLYKRTLALLLASLHPSKLSEIPAH
jgi:hypothetical protein